MTAQASQPAPRRRPAPRAAAASDPGHMRAEVAGADEGAAPGPASEALDPTAMFALVTGQGQQGAGFSFKVQATGALFRCQVMRNPNQPRFWCLTIFLCLDGGSPDTDQPRWLSNDRFSREEMMEALESVRANLTGWLSEPSRGELRAWVLAQTSRSPMSSNPRFASSASAL